MSRKCLLDAIDLIRQDRDMDDALRAQAVHTLTKIAEDQALTAAQTKAQLIAAAKELRRAAYIQKVSESMQDIKTEEIMTRLAAIEDPGKRASFWRGLLEGAGTYSMVDDASVGALIRQLEMRTLARLNPVWEYISEARLTRRFGTIAESDNAHQFNLALHGAKEGIDPRAIELAALWRETVGPLLQRMRDAGKWVGQLDDWGYQSHSPSRMTGQFDEWRAFFLEHADPEFHPDPDATSRVLFDSILTRHLDDGGSGSVSFGRKIHFKTPEAAVEYTARFGDMDTHFGLMEKARNIVRQTVLAERLGPIAGRAIEEVSAQVEKQAARALGQAQADLSRPGLGGSARAAAKATKKAAETSLRDAGRARMIGHSLTGALARPVNAKVANVMGAARNWMVFQYLGQIPMAMLGTDSLISVIGGRFHTGGFASSFGAHFKAVSSIMREGPMREYATQLGVWNNAMTMAVMDRYATPFAMSELAKGTFGQLATAAQRLSGAHALERAMRTASMIVVSQALVKHMGRTWGDLHPKYRKVLEGNGFTKAKWDDLRTHGRAIPDIDVLDFDALPHHLKEHVTAFMYREADTMTLYPGYYDRAMLTFGASAGTLPGELAATATQFWSWPISMMRKVMARELAMGGTGAIGSAAALIVGGAVTVQMYALAKNQPIFEWDAPELWVRALARSGLLTPIGELALNAAKYDRVEVGPIGGTGATLAKSFYQTGTDYLSGESKRAARRTVQNVADLGVPNIWWMQFGVTSRAMDAIMWEMDPKYMRARERRWRDEGRDLK